VATFRTFIPLTDFVPDEGRLRTSNLIQLEGFVPYSQHDILPAQGWVSKSLTFAGTVYGMGCNALNGPNGYLVYVGYGTDLASIDTTTLAVTVRSGPSAPYTFGAEGAQFLAFGKHEVCAPGLTSPVQIRLADAGNFLDCFTSADKPKAKFVCGIGERAVFANIANTGTAGAPDPNPDLVWWTKTGDLQTIGNPATLPADRTDFQALYDDYGGITGLSGSREYALIFKQGVIYRMDFGSPFGFGFSPIPNSYGTIYPNSIVRAGEDVFFWGPSGPMVFRQGQVLPLALGRVGRALTDRTFLAESTTPTITPSAGIRSVVGAFCPVTGVIAWGFPKWLSAATDIDTILLYNVAFDRFSILDVGGAATAGLGVTYAMTQVPHEAHDFSALRRILRVVQQPAGALNKLVAWEPGGAYADARGSFRTGYFNLHASKQVIVKRARLVYAKQAFAATDPVYTISCYTRNFGNDTDVTATGSSVTDMDSSLHFVSLNTPAANRRAANLHAFGVAFGGDSTQHPAKTTAEIEGLEIEGDFAGELV